MFQKPQGNQLKFLYPVNLKWCSWINLRKNCKLNSQKLQQQVMSVSCTLTVNKGGWKLHNRYLQMGQVITAILWYNTWVLKRPVKNWLIFIQTFKWKPCQEAIRKYHKTLALWKTKIVEWNHNKHKYIMLEKWYMYQYENS